MCHFISYIHYETFEHDLFSNLVPDVSTCGELCLLFIGELVKTRRDYGRVGRHRKYNPQPPRGVHSNSHPLSQTGSAHEIDSPTGVRSSSLALRSVYILNVYTVSSVHSTE